MQVCRKDTFEVEVALELVRKGFRVIPQFDVAGRRIDLVVEGGHARLAVECDGDEWHGADRYEEDMQRQRILERCGWEFFRVRASQFYSGKQTALNRLWNMLNERGIHPQLSKEFTEDKKTQMSDQQRPVSSGNVAAQKTGTAELNKPMGDTKVEVGDTVVYVSIESPQNEKQALITRERSNPEWGTVNIDAPIAQAFLGARVGDTVEAKLPMGSMHLLIKKIRKSSV